MEIITLVAITAALLFATLKFKKASFNGSNWIALGTAAIAGLAILGTGFPGWLSGLLGPLNVLFGAGLLAVGVTLAVDLLDKKPHTPALVCAALLPTLLVFGVASIDEIPRLIGNGASRVESSVS